MVNKITVTLFLIISNNIFTSYGDTCTGIHIQNSSTSTCSYITSTTSCNPKGYISYLQIYYCNFSSFPQTGFILLLTWLFVLFYTLSNTASYYFCPAVEHLSKSLNLSPAIAGTTLLPLGNGSTDVFSTVIAFTTTADGGDIGLNSVLGGCIFVTSVVVGVMSLLITYQKKVVVVDKPNFIRDVVFLLVTLMNVLVIVIIGEISLWWAIVFVFSYVIYILLVCYIHFINQKLVFGSVNGDGNDHVITVPLLCSVEDENAEKVVYCEEQVVGRRRCGVTIVKLLLYVVKLPVYLPRRVTIPVVTKERWSKPFLVISMVLGPLMVAVIWNTKVGDLGLKGSLVTYLVVGVIGIGLGSCTYAFTSSSMPPQRCLVFWYASGFLMSVTWTYVTCNELVSLLESLGNIIGMNPSIIGLTVLAWGNSIGDLATNVALAMYGGPHGPQIAMSGCYAGPLFNVLIGLGFSFVFVSWSKYPATYVIPEDPNLCETIGFLMAGLLWALVILTKREMRLDHTLGGGLLVIYLCFLFIKLARAIGLLG